MDLARRLGSTRKLKMMTFKLTARKASDVEKNQQRGRVKLELSAVKSFELWQLQTDHNRTGNVDK